MPRTHLSLALQRLRGGSVTPCVTDLLVARSAGETTSQAPRQIHKTNAAYVPQRKKPPPPFLPPRATRRPPWPPNAVMRCHWRSYAPSRSASCVILSSPETAARTSAPPSPNGCLGAAPLLLLFSFYHLPASSSPLLSSLLPFSSSPPSPSSLPLISSSPSLILSLGREEGDGIRKREEGGGAGPGDEGGGAGGVG